MNLDPVYRALAGFLGKIKADVSIAMVSLGIVDVDGNIIFPSQNDVRYLDGNGAPTSGATASFTTSLTGTNNDLVWTARLAGADGNAISVAYVDPGAINQALAAVVTGTAIVINLATDGTGVITTTAAQIAALAAFGSIVSVANAGGNDGSGVVTAMSATNLSGGVNGTGFGFAGKGSRYIDVATANRYKNTGTKSAPTWASD